MESGKRWRTLPRASALVENGAASALPYAPACDERRSLPITTVIAALADFAIAVSSDKDRVALRRPRTLLYGRPDSSVAPE